LPPLLKTRACGSVRLSAPDSCAAGVAAAYDRPELRPPVPLPQPCPQLRGYASRIHNRSLRPEQQQEQAPGEKTQRAMSLASLLTLFTLVSRSAANCPSRHLDCSACPPAQRIATSSHRASRRPSQRPRGVQTPVDDIDSATPAVPVYEAPSRHDLMNRLTGTPQGRSTVLSHRNLSIPTTDSMSSSPDGLSLSARAKRSEPAYQQRRHPSSSHRLIMPDATSWTSIIPRSRPRLARSAKEQGQTTTISKSAHVQSPSTCGRRWRDRRRGAISTSGSQHLPTGAAGSVSPVG